MPTAPSSLSTSTIVQTTGPNQPPGLVSKSSKSEAFVTRLRLSVAGLRENPTSTQRTRASFMVARVAIGQDRPVPSARPLGRAPPESPHSAPPLPDATSPLPTSVPPGALPRCAPAGVPDPPAG